MHVALRRIRDNGTEWGDGHECADTEVYEVLLGGYRPVPDGEVRAGERAQAGLGSKVIEARNGRRYWLRCGS